ncbi:hypothetical protein [Stanieria cyanosphaera]|uniref:hypothetical protein n=1 Tax=Stanieria cyanosphaera TaxID=102116 RepID=UPI0002DDF06A|nr:hypothetical protein [Stanieria cyanosphaera]
MCTLGIKSLRSKGEKKNIQNLFNQEYFESAYGDLNVYSGEPFTVQGTVSWEF